MSSTALHAFLAASLVSLATNVEVTTLRSPHPQVGGGFGVSVSGAGDVDRDGVVDVDRDGSAEILVGALSIGPGGSGRAFVFRGSDGSLLRRLQSDRVNFFNDFGRSVSGAGDVDQDGSPDVVVGAPSEGFNGEAFGRAYVFSSLES